MRYLKGKRNPNFKYDISKEQLYNMYWVKLLSKKEIAKKFGCHTCTIARRLKEFEIRNRTRRKYHISKKEIYDLYWGKDLTIEESGKRLGSSYKVIRNRMLEYNIPRRTKAVIATIDGRRAAKHYCIEPNCNNEICYMNWFYGSKRCNSCAKSGENSPSKRPEVRKKISENHADNRGRKSANYKEERHKKYYCKEKGCNNEITYQTWKYGNVHCYSCANSGKNNYRFGKPAPHIKGDYYEGIWMRSSYEIAFAQFLTLSHIKWLYEPKAFNLGYITYRPDFYIPEWDLWIEIKGWWRDKGKQKFELFQQLYPKTKIKVLMKSELQELGVL